MVYHGLARRVANADFADLHKQQRQSSSDLPLPQAHFVRVPSDSPIAKLAPICCIMVGCGRQIKL
jgi:hypothetical protein